MNKAQVNNIISEVDMGRPSESNTQAVRIYRIPVYWYKLNRLEMSKKFKHKIFVKAVKKSQGDKPSLGHIGTKYKQRKLTAEAEGIEIDNIGENKRIW